MFSLVALWDVKNIRLGSLNPKWKILSYFAKFLSISLLIFSEIHKGSNFFSK